VKRAWLRFINATLNRVTARTARRGGAFVLVRTVGRKSGRIYETPIIAPAVPGGFMVELTYGPEVNWYRNARAAGGCEIVVAGVAHRIVAFDEVDAAVGLAAFTPFQRIVLRLLRRRDFVRFVEG
jgi:hypothetical protein